MEQNSTAVVTVVADDGVPPPLRQRPVLVGGANLSTSLADIPGRLKLKPEWEVEKTNTVRTRNSTILKVCTGFIEGIGIQVNSTTII